MEQPNIYTKNYVQSGNVFEYSHGSSLGARLYDKDRSAQYQTSGGNDDTTEISVTVHFYEGGVAVSRTLTNVMVLNHNLKDIAVDYWDGSAWQALTTASAISDSHTFLSFSSQATERIRIRATETQTADQEKLMGELIACALQLQVGEDLAAYTVMERQQAYETRLADGSLIRTVVRRDSTRSSRYTARVGFKFLTQSELEALLAIKTAGTAFYWQPEPTQRPEELYYVHWLGNATYNYVTSYKGAGFEINAMLEEA